MTERNSSPLVSEPPLTPATLEELKSGRMPFEMDAPRAVVPWRWAKQILERLLTKKVAFAVGVVEPHDDEDDESVSYTHWSIAVSPKDQKAFAEAYLEGTD